MGPRAPTGGCVPGWNIAASPGTPQPDGTLRNIQAGQFVVPGQTASPLNPILEIWRGKWTPTNFTARTFTFTAQGASGVGANTAHVLVKFGTAPGGEPQYVGVPATSNLSLGVHHHWPGITGRSVLHVLRQLRLHHDSAVPEHQRLRVLFEPFRRG
jgi:hypothetical protein